MTKVEFEAGDYVVYPTHGVGRVTGIEKHNPWPNITRQGTPPSDAAAFDGVAGKYEKYFTANPGKGDG